MSNRKFDRTFLSGERISAICERAGVCQKVDWIRRLINTTRASWVSFAGPRNGDIGAYKITWEFDAFIGGTFMEETANLLNALNAEVGESKKILQTMVNDIRALSENIQPELAKMIKQIRENRMAVVLELRQSLDSLKNVQNFFMDSKYESEMEKMERFIRVCKEIMELKKDGIFDDICDSAIRLALREARKNEGS
jgi:hypothetical protein